jgi:hypothetical protein
MAPFASHLLFEGIEFRGYTGVSLDTPLDVLGPGAVTFTNAAAISATSNRQDIIFRGCTFSAAIKVHKGIWSDDTAEPVPSLTLVATLVLASALGGAGLRRARLGGRLRP